MSSVYASKLASGAVRSPARKAQEGVRAAAHQREDDFAEASLTPDLGGSGVDRVVQQAGTPLPAALRQEVEARFGHDFSQVRVHSDQAAAESASALNAKAYTLGNHIVFGAGQYTPQAAAGRRLLGHELAHVIQQSRGGAEPELNPQASHEQSAHRAASQFVGGQGAIAVGGGTAVGVAREPLEEEEDERQQGQASSTVLNQKNLSSQEHPKIKVEKNADKGRGTGAEVTVPFDRYSGSDWNHIGGGSETASSRTSLARRSTKDVEKGNQEGTAGLDFLVENIRTGRLVIGEQKATKATEFVKATAITTSLETNLAHTVQVLRQRIADGKVHPSEVARLQNTINRLELTLTALQKPTNDTRLPPDVVFELTNLGGKGKTIGTEHLKLLEAKYGKTPGFLQHLLERTFVRDPSLAASRKRSKDGKRGTDADPDVVPALDLLNKPGKDMLNRIQSGKTQKEWDKQKKAEEKTRQAQEKKEREKREKAEKKAREEAASKKKAALDEQRKAVKAKLKQDADEVAAKARQKHLDELREQRAKKGEPEPKTKKARGADETAANKAGKQARKDYVDDVERKRKADSDARKQQLDAQRAAREKAEEQAKAQKEQARKQAEADALAKERALADAVKKIDARESMTPEDWAKLPASERQLLEQAAAKDPKLAQKLNEKVNAKQTADFDEHAKRTNAKADENNKRRVPKGEERMSKAAHRLNQAAAGIRAFDAFDEARKQGKGYAEATFDAGKTYLENTNPLLGGLATFEKRMKTEKLPDGREQQVYGEDAGDAFFGTLGENLAGFVVPGAGWDQLINASANVFGAADDHMNRDDPAAAAKGPSTARSSVDLAAEMTPSRMFAQTVGGGLRAFYDLGKAGAGSDTSLEKFADDGVRGKLGAVIQPWAMAADFFGELGGSDASTALDKTLKKAEDTSIGRLGNAGGDAMFDLGQSRDAKAGKYGGAVQSVSTVLGVTTDLIAGKNFNQAIDSAAEQGSTDAKIVAGVRDTAHAAADTAREVWNEDIPAAKEKAEEVIDHTIDKAKAIYDDPGAAASNAWNALKRLGD